MIATSKDLDREIYKRSLYHFVEYAFGLQHHNAKFEQAPHYKKMCDYIEPHLRRVFAGLPSTLEYLIVNIPPRTLKSKIFSVYLPVWCWLHHSTKFVCTSYSSEISISLSQDCKDLVNHPDFQNLFGNKVKVRKGDDNKKAFTTEHGGARFSTSTDGSVMGKGFHIAVIDDPVNVKNAFSDKLRESAKRHVFVDIPSRFDDQRLSLQIVVMQRVHEDDITGAILELEKEGSTVGHICLPIKLDDNCRFPDSEPKDLYTDGYLLPERFNQSVLDKLQRQMGTLHFVGQYMQSPSAADGNLFKRDMFQLMDADAMRERIKGLTPHMWVDTATHARSHNDFTAWLIGVPDIKTRKLYIIKAAQKRVEAADIPKLLVKEFKHRASPKSCVFIENAASGGMVIQSMKRYHDLNVKEFKHFGHIKANHDKYSRAAGVVAFAEYNNVYLLEADWNDKFIENLISFPNAKHDDMVDTAVMGMSHAMLAKR